MFSGGDGGPVDSKKFTWPNKNKSRKKNTAPIVIDPENAQRTVYQIFMTNTKPPIQTLREAIDHCYFML